MINPFGLSSAVTGDSAPAFVDIDSDGDLDMLAGEFVGETYYRENIGTATVPSFAARVLLFTTPSDRRFWHAPSLTDLDGDGDPDAIVGEEFGSLYYLQNTTPRNFASFVVNVTAEDDAASAADDAFSTAENAAPTSGNVFANNGAGADSDPDGLLVTAVNGNAASVGTQITLASGALLTLNADGTFSYDPNGAFDELPAAGSGAANLTATDSFTYTLDGGDTATVTVSISGVDSNDALTGTAGNDILRGGNGQDVAVFDFESHSATWSPKDSGGYTGTHAGIADQLYGIETFRFLDRDVDPAVLGNSPAPFEDGIDDVLWRDAQGELHGWILDRSGINGWASRSYGGTSSSSAVGGVGDFNGDGNLDVLVRNAQGSLQTWCLDQSGFNGADSRILDSPGATTDVLIGDFNGDGTDDIAWQEANGRFGTWIVDSTGIDGSASRILGGPTAREIVAVGDFNGDGNDDLLWRDGNQIGTLIVDRTGINGEASRILGATGATTRVAGVGDFNADGIDDLLWQEASGRFGFCIVDRTGINGAASRVLGTTAEIVGVGDFNDDGQADTLYRESDGRLGTLIVDQTGLSGADSRSLGYLDPGTEVAGIGDVNGNWLL